MPRLRVPPDLEPVRLDVWLSRQCAEPSRARWQALIQERLVLVDGQACKPRHRLHGGEEIEYEIPEAKPVALEAEAIDLVVLFEDTDLIVIDKPAGLVVHPAPGHDAGTLVNALLHHCRDLTGIGGERRPGIVHRLDKDTSGILVVAKNDAAMHELQRQFKAREVHKEYAALVWGVLGRESGTVDAPISRHRHHRTRMAVVQERGRRAVTHWSLVEAFEDVSWVRLRIETGRTHQIRVHMAHLGHPVVGDAVYGGLRKRHPLRATRQMLHAEVLRIAHPRTGEPLLFEAPLPADFRALLHELGAQERG